MDKEPVFSITGAFSKLIRLSEDKSRRLIRILSVSWDALWSGPAKAAQALAGGWTLWEVVFSFPIAGLTVAIVAHQSLRLARRFQLIKFESTKQMATWLRWGKYVELSVIGGFGVLSLGQVITPEISLYGAIMIAGILLLFVWLFWADEIKQKSFKEAEEAVIGEETAS